MGTPHSRKQAEKTGRARYKKQFEFLSKTANLFAIALFSIFPLAVFKDYTNITEAKLITFLVLVIGFSTTVIFVFGGVFLDGFRPSRKPPTVHLPMIFLGCYLFFAVLSVLFSPERSLKNEFGRSAFWFGSGRYDGFLMLLCYLAVFIILSFFGSFQKVHIYTLAGTLAVMSVIGIVQTFGVNVFALYPPKSYHGELDNFISTVGNFDFFSAMVSIMIPIVVFSALLLDFGIIQKVLLLLSGALGSYLLFSLNVSSGKLAITVTFALAVPFWMILAKKPSAWLGIGILILEIILFAGFLFWVYARVPVQTDSNAVNRGLLTEISNILHGYVDETTGTYRIGIWQSAFQLWQKRPLLGTGMGTFMKTFADYTKGELLAFSGGRIDTCHNEYLQILCVGGVFGLLSYLGFLGSLAVGSIRFARQNKEIFVLSSGVFCYSVQAFFNFSIIVTAPVIWAVFGLLNYNLRSMQNEENL